MAIFCVSLTLVLFLTIFFFRKIIKPRFARCTIRGLILFNTLLFVIGCIFGISAVRLSAQPLPDNNQQPGPGNVQSEQPQNNSSSANLAAALAVGLAAIGAGIAVGITGSAAIGGITQNPGVFGRSLVFVGLAEGIAIYGLIIAFLILTRAFGG